MMQDTIIVAKINELNIDCVDSETGSGVDSSCSIDNRSRPGEYCSCPCEDGCVDVSADGSVDGSVDGIAVGSAEPHSPNGIEVSL